MLTSHINPAPSLSFKLRQLGRMVTSPLRVKPDFLIVGAKKCGTTALYSYLTAHPAITPAFKKEIYYFINSLVTRGVSCILISSELEEIIGLCTRVLVMREGRITVEMEGDHINEEEIMFSAAGVRDINQRKKEGSSEIH